MGCICSVSVVWLFMETIMVVGEFFVVEFDVGSGIFKEKGVVLEEGGWA